MCFWFCCCYVKRMANDWREEWRQRVNVLGTDRGRLLETDKTRS